MDEDIVCRKCDSPSCKGCNLKNLEIMLNNGKFDCLMNENHCINPSDDIAPVRHGQWIIGNGLQAGYRECSRCGEIVKYEYSLYGVHNFCNYCGAKMDGEVQ